VDKTNQSYYGETKLNYLTTDRAFEGIVPLSKFLGFDNIYPLISGILPYHVLAEKDGPVHDVQWSSSGSEFAVVYGCILIFTVFICNVEFQCLTFYVPFVLFKCSLTVSVSQLCRPRQQYSTRSATLLLSLVKDLTIR